MCNPIPTAHFIFGLTKPQIHGRLQNINKEHYYTFLNDKALWNFAFCYDALVGPVPSLSIERHFRGRLILMTGADFMSSSALIDRIWIIKNRMNKHRYSDAEEPSDCNTPPRYIPGSHLGCQEMGPSQRTVTACPGSEYD